MSDPDPKWLWKLWFVMAALGITFTVVLMVGVFVGIMWMIKHM